MAIYSMLLMPWHNVAKLLKAHFCSLLKCKSSARLAGQKAGLGSASKKEGSEATLLFGVFYPITSFWNKMKAGWHGGS